MMSAKRYTDHRKKYLKEYYSLQIKRLELSKEIRKLKKELDDWDRALTNN